MLITTVFQPGDVHEWNKHMAGFLLSDPWTLNLCFRYILYWMSACSFCSR